MATARRQDRGRVEADTVVRDGAADRLGLAADPDLDVRGVGVSRRVRQRFLDDPVQRRLHARRQATLRRARHRHGDPGALRDAFRQELQGGHEPEVVEHRRTELVRQTPELALDPVEQPPNLFEAALGGRRQIAGQARQRDVHRGEQLRRLVVQRVRDALGLFLEPLVQAAQRGVRLTVPAVHHLERREAFH